MNGALLQSTYALREFHSLLQYNLKLRFSFTFGPAISVGVGQWTIPKMLPFLKMSIYTSTYAVAEYSAGTNRQECSLRGGIRGRVREDVQGYGAEAAARLKVKEQAIRKRIQRGTLAHDKDDDGRVHVYLVPEDRATGGGNGIDTGVCTLVQSLKEQIAYLR